MKSEADLQVIAATSARNNKNVDVTGMLLYSDGDFMQLLEGPGNTVEALYARIGLDQRHHKLRRILLEPIDTRAFGDWSMGFARMTREDLLMLPGCRDFFSANRKLFDIDNSQSKKILQAFLHEQWGKRLR